MRLEYTTRSGRFNLLSDEESLSCHFRLYDLPEDYPLKSTGASITPEYDEEGNDPEDAATLIREYQEKLWLSTSWEDHLAFAQYLEDHAKEIREGNRLYRLAEIEKQIDRLTNERKSLIEV